MIERRSIDRDNPDLHPQTRNILQKNTGEVEEVTLSEEVDEESHQQRTETETQLTEDNSASPPDRPRGEHWQAAMEYWLDLKRTPLQRAYFGRWAQKIWREWEFLMERTAAPEPNPSKTSKGRKKKALIVLSSILTSQ